MYKDLIIIGAGGLARDVLEYALDIGEDSSDIQWRIKGFITDIDYDFYDKNTFGYKIIGNISEHRIENNNLYVLAIADMNFRIKVANHFMQRGAEFINLIHPKANISKSAKIGIGNIFAPYTLIGSNVDIGDFTITRPYVVCGHDSQIRDNCILLPNSTIGGKTIIGERTYIGSGSVIRDGIVIGQTSVVGMGSVVTKDIENNSVVVGNPAKYIRKNNNDSIFN